MLSIVIAEESLVPRTHPTLALRPPKWQGPGPPDWDLMQKAAIGSQSWGGEQFTAAWVWPVGGLGTGSGALQDTAPCLFRALQFTGPRAREAA